MPSLKSIWTASLSAVGAVSLWGLAFPLIQEGLVDFSPVMLGFLRFALASALLMAVAVIVHSPRELGAVLRHEWRPLLLFGLLYVTVPNIAQNIGLQHGVSSIASVIQSSGPAFTLIFAVLLLKERMTSMKALGTVVALTGTVLLVGSGSISLEDEDFTANVLILVSAMCYALAWVTAKPMLERSPPLPVITLSVVLGTLLLGVAVPFEPSPEAALTTGSALLNLALLGFICGSGSTVLFLYALEREEVSRMAFFIYLMPLFASFFAWMIRGEGVAAWTVACGMIIVAGITIANRRAEARKDRSAS